MTERRTAKTVLNLHQVGQVLNLHPSQRVVHMYVTDDPHQVVFVIEGGAELPELDPHFTYAAREHGWESPYVTADKIPYPET